MKTLLLAACGALLALGGCAKYPASGGGQAGFRLTMWMTMAGEINPNYVYIVAVNPSTTEVPTVQGPIPVISPPWGNGFVAGNATHFVRWDGFQSPRYQIYAFRDANLLEYLPVGIPVNYIDVQPGGRRLEFEIELEQIAGTFDPETIRALQVNFLTMNVVPQGSTGDKIWDALGDGRLPSQINDNVTVPMRVGTYNNATFQDREPAGDCIDPGLDIVNWQIEIRD